MSDAKDQHEPSMEEILASIRRIISEDGDGGEPGAEAEAKPATPAAAPSAPAAEAAPSSDAPAEAAPAAAPKRLLIADVEEEEPVKEEEDDSDILMLTEEAEDELAAPPLDDSPLSLEPDEPPPEPEREPEPESEPIFARAVEPMPQPESEPAAEPVDDNDRLLSERAAAASLAAMSELVTRSHREPNIESLHMGQANQTLEDLTRELLRPILKSWLDDNLPQIVERIVREEIGRLALDAQRR